LCRDVAAPHVQCSTAHRIYARYVRTYICIIRVVQGAIRAIVFSAQLAFSHTPISQNNAILLPPAHGRNAHTALLRASSYSGRALKTVRETWASYYRYIRVFAKHGRRNFWPGIIARYATSASLSLSVLPSNLRARAVESGPMHRAILPYL